MTLDVAAPRALAPGYRDALDALAGHQKTSKGAPAYSRFVNRRLGRYAAAFAFTRGLTPDQVTGASAVCTFAGIAGLALARPSAGLAVVVTGALVAGYALDSADGQLARLRGGGSLAGEWLDHVLDAAKTVALHAAVLISTYRFTAGRTWTLLVPLAYLCVASAWFFTVILTDQLRRAAVARGAAAPAPRSGAPLLRSLLALPTDYGFLCLVFLLLGTGPLFLGAYGVMLAGTALFFAAALPSWFRELAATDRAVARA